MARTRSPPPSRGSRQRFRTQQAESSTGNRPLRGPGGEEINLVGVDGQQVESNPQQYIGEVFKGAHFRKLSVPDTVRAGGTIKVKGVVHFDSPTQVVFTVGMRVRAFGPSLQEDVIERYRNIQHCNARAFTLEIPAPETVGQTVTFNVAGESTTVTGDWDTGDQRGPFRVKTVSSGEKTTEQAVSVAPYAAAGAGAGYLVNQIRGGPTNLRLIGAGAAAGVGLKTFGPDLSTIDINFPTTEIAVLGGTAAALAILLNSTGASDVLGAGGEVAGSAISGAGSAARGAVSAVRDR